MSKYDFMYELRRKLKRIPKEERDSAISYYEEYFEDSNKSDEEVIAELGSPSKIASEILADYAINNKNAGFRDKIIIIILAILAAPVGIPVAITAVLLIFAGLLLVGSISLAVLLGAIGTFFAGIVSLVSSFVVLFTEPAVASFYCGFGLLVLGISILLAAAFKSALPKFSVYFKNAAAKLLAKLNNIKAVKR